MIEVQTSFIGGMRLDVDPSLLGMNEYNVLINGRSRYDNIQLIDKPALQTVGLSGTNYQGTYAADNLHLVFIDGKAFVKDFFSPASAYTEVVGFQLDPSVDYIYAELVPASRNNLVRQAGSSPNQGITLGSVTSGTPQAVVCQDGINRPLLIETGLIAREANGYTAWTTGDREYVPIGKQMAYANAKLYVVSPDGKQIFHSVSGRPLDFVVAIDATGDKINTDETIGGAEAVSIGVDYNAITCLVPAGTEDGALLVTTNKNSYLLIPTPTDTLYGEPKYKSPGLFSTGAVNQFSVTDVLGDMSLVSFSGIHSFNAALQLKNEGKNSPFSSSVYALFKDVVQTNPCAINHDDYAMYGVDTIYGPGILVYDTLRKKFNSIDLLEGVGSVKMFAEIKIQGIRKLLFITATGLYAFGDGDEKEECKLLTRQFSANAPRHQLKSIKVSAAFCCLTASVNGSVRIFTDMRSQKSYDFTLAGAAAPVGSEVPIPLDHGDDSKEFTIDTPTEKRGNKVAALITYDGAGELGSLSLELNQSKRK